MLKEITDIVQRCEKVEAAAKEELSKASSQKEWRIQSTIIQVIRNISSKTLLEIFAEHVRNNLKAVKDMQIGTPEADEYIKSIMGDYLTVRRNGNYLGISVFIERDSVLLSDSYFSFNIEDGGEEWGTIANIERYRRPYEPEEIADIVADVYRDAEEIGILRAKLDKKEESLKEKHPCMLPMIAFAKKNALTQGKP